MHPRTRQVLAIALPIIGGMTSQNILNLVDTAMVAHLGAPVLAGVGLASFLNFMAVAFITGLSSEIAQTLVTLGVDLGKVNAVGDLQGGIEEAERLLGYTVISGAVDKADDRV